MTWSELVDAAVMGTSRQAAGADIPDPPAHLLRRAAELSRARRAGYRAPLAADRPAPAPAPADSRPQVAQAAAWRLEDLLAGGDHELAAEWLRLVAAGGSCRPPDVLLPALLTLATHHAELRAALLPVLGPLAAWLTDFNQDWDWVVTGRPAADGPQADQQLWQTGTGAARRALLTRVRASDAAAGRDLVASTWDSESYRDRAAFLGLLVTGFGPADEPLLVRGLADRQAEVRATAAGLLARLAGSAYSQRAAARAAATVRVEQAGRARKLVLTLPELTAADLAADGLNAAQVAHVRTKGSRLRHIVATAPAGLWAGHAGLDPAGLLELADETDWPEQLRQGWAHAAVRDKDEAWLIALLDLPGKPDADRDLPLLRALSSGTLADWLELHPGSPLLLPVLEVLRAPWPARLSALVRTVLAEVAARGEAAFAARALIRIAAMRLEPPEPPPDVAVAEQLSTTWNHFLQTLSVRAAMRRELAEEPHQ